METLDYSLLDDAILIRMIVKEQSGALGELYDRYGRLIFSLARSIVGDQAAAEEITQDVFVNVWEKAATYRPEKAKVSTWLTSIARNRSIDQLRHRGARPEQHSVTWAEVPPGAVPSVDSPAEVAEVHMQQLQVRQAVAQLPDEQKEVLALAYFQGYTQQEIADRLNLPLGTVKTRIRLAMGKLRQWLQDEVPA